VVALKSSAEILINILESFSFNVTCALSGTEAIALIKDSAVQYDLIVMDCNMPKLDGIGTAKQIKNISPVPIIIMSSVNGLNDVYEKVKESGIEGFLVKPVTQSILFDAIMDVFGKSRRSTPIQSRGSTPIQSRGSTPIKGRRTTPINKRWSYDNNENIGVETPHYKNITILLVEDNEINQQVAMELMEKTGLIVEIASNGKEAVEMVNKSRYDAVLMDIQMPVMDGYSAAIEIRKNPDFKYLPILAMTANAMTGDREKSLKAGMNDHISKPIDPIELFTILDIWLKNDNVMGALISNTQPVIAKQLELNGIDTKVGLQRVGSNQEFYINMLKKFSINQKNTIDEIQSAIAIGDFELAIRLAHTLKGISGTIGASIVSRVSGVLEDALTKGDTEAVNAQITIVKMELDIVLAAIDGLKANDNQGQRPIDNQGYNIDIKELKELTGKISEFLKDDDTQAIQYIQRLKEQFPEISAMNEFKRLEAMIERYDFEGSLEILNRMTEILRI
jgi:CheY-like chemotaxis protein